MKLSTHFTLAEMMRSEFALRHGIDNTPNETQRRELILLCGNILESVRSLFSSPVKILSGFRNPVVNAGIGGSPTSQHIRGQAADIEVVGVSNRVVVNIIRNSAIDFDQLIYEFGEDGWVHISRSGHPRLEVLEAYKDGGRTHYKPYVPT